MANRHNNFSLIELLVTIAIVIILAGILIGGLSFVSRRNDEVRTRTTIQQFAMGIEKFRIENGYYPLAKPANTGSAEAQKQPITVKLKLDADGNMILLVGGKEYNFFTATTKAPYCQFSWVTTSEVELQDSWDRPIYYQCPGAKNKTAYDVWSEGMDKTNSEDDIGNWNEN